MAIGEMTGFARLILGATVALAGPGAAASGADWPAYRHGPGRRAFTGEQIATPLSVQWTHVPQAGPKPAWPDPVREIHMMDFDHAFHPVAADGTVFYGSSADHQVHALDLATGRQRWTFHTDGPVRFAPAVSEGKLYVASDDGQVYCLSATDGKLIWRFRAAGDERVMGNEQMISRWPLRSGVLVADGVVYFTAGMWPAEGVWSFALTASDGSVVWKVRQPASFAPQGYMAADGKTLLAPAGRSQVWVIDRKTGAGRRGMGHSRAMVAGALAVTGSPPFKANESLPITGSPPRRERTQSVVVWPIAGKGKGRRLAGKGPVAADETTLYAAGGGKLTAYTLGTFARRWEVACGRVFALAVAGEAVIVGGDKTVTLVSAATGKMRWSAPLDGEARGLAVADGRLLVSTHTGRITCFGPGAAPAGAVAARRPAAAAPDAVATALAERILRDTQVTAGFCLAVGAGGGRVAMELARQSKLHIICAEADSRKVAATRKALDAAGVYGSRVTVHHVAGPALPYPDYFADLVVVLGAGGAGAIPSPSELHRVLRPCGGVAWRGGRAGASEPWIRGEALTDKRMSPTTECVRRGTLPGAGDWTHLYADAGNSGSSGDSRVRWPLKMLWFGKPGPGRMMNRHWRGTAPVVAAGRMFILGQHSIIAVNAYNGRELWSHRMPSIQRRVVDIRGGSMAVDAESLYVSTGDVCLRFDAATGKLRRTYRLPVRRPRLAIGDGRTLTVGDGGQITITADNAGLTLTLTTTDAKVACADPKGAPAGGDSWELFFDFRPAAGRTGLYGPGAFHALIVAGAAQAPGPRGQSGPWSACPPLRVAGKLTQTGSLTTVRLAWDEMAKLVGARPADFAFGAILNSSDNGKTLTGRTYAFANAASYRLANAQATLVLDATGAAPQTPSGPALPAPEGGLSLGWGQLYVNGEVIVGTAAEQRDTAAALKYGWDFASENNDYTGPPVAKVLGIVGVKPQTRTVFALNKDDGKPLWVHTAAGTVSHNALAVGAERLYLIDRTAKGPPVDAKRRGRTPVQDAAALEALDLLTGRRAWRSVDGLGDGHQLRLGNGVLLTASMKGMTAHSPADGRVLWTVARKQPMHHCSAFLRAPVITRKWVYDEPHAYDLRTGKVRMAGKGATAWTWSGGTGCGTVSGAENLLLFRNRAPAVLDVAGDTGQHLFTGIRPGCYINMIAAGGLVLMPEAASGCGCPYAFQTTVVMMPK